MLRGCKLAGEGEGQQDEDLASGTAVMMSAFATAGGGVGVAYANTAFRNLGLMEFDLADLEGVVVQVDVEVSGISTMPGESCSIPQISSIARNRHRGSNIFNSLCLISLLRHCFPRGAAVSSTLRVGHQD